MVDLDRPNCWECGEIIPNMPGYMKNVKVRLVCKKCVLKRNPRAYATTPSSWEDVITRAFGIELEGIAA